VTGAEIATLAHAEQADLEQAAAAAERGFRAWRDVAAFERSKIMRKAAELLRSRGRDCATAHAGGVQDPGRGREPGDGRGLDATQTRSFSRVTGRKHLVSFAENQAGP